VSWLSDEEIYQEVGKIVTRFELLECYECAEAVMQWLNDNGIEGKVIRLKTKYRDEDFILSDRLMRQGNYDSVTINGKHYGVEVRGKVFDNLSTTGMIKDDWVNDFHCQSEQFDIKYLEFL
jgi:Ni,Fe-hydrogenase III large subunit